MAHTPEPWIADDETTPATHPVEWVDDYFPMRQMTHNDYARACLCVNGCAGVESDLLAKGNVAVMIGRLVMQRAELLAACKAFQSAMRSYTNGHADFLKLVEALQVADAATAKVERSPS